MRQAWAVSLASAGRITRQAWHGAQRGQVLDGLVGGAVLAQAHRVVCPRVDDVALRQRRQPDRRAHVVAEDEEGAAHREHAAVAGHAGHGRAHGVLADPVVDLVALGVLGGLVDTVRQLHARVAGEVSGPGHQPRDHLGGGVDAPVDRHARGQAGAGLEDRKLLGPALEAATVLARLPHAPCPRPRRRSAPATPRAAPRRARGSAGRARRPRRGPRTARRAEGRGSPWSRGPRPRRAGRRGRRRCRSCGARASRCGCGEGSSRARSSTAMARRSAASRASVSLATSPMLSVCQP